jgi:hypothetical protein
LICRDWGICALEATQRTALLAKADKPVAQRALRTRALIAALGGVLAALIFAGGASADEPVAALLGTVTSSTTRALAPGAQVVQGVVSPPSPSSSSPSPSPSPLSSSSSSIQPPATSTAPPQPESDAVGPLVDHIVAVASGATTTGGSMLERAAAARAPRTSAPANGDAARGATGRERRDRVSSIVARPQRLAEATPSATAASAAESASRASMRSGDRPQIATARIGASARTASSRSHTPTERLVNVAARTRLVPRLAGAPAQIAGQIAPGQSAPGQIEGSVAGALDRLVTLRPVVTLEPVSALLALSAGLLAPRVSLLAPALAALRPLLSVVVAPLDERRVLPLTALLQPPESSRSATLRQSASADVASRALAESLAPQLRAALDARAETKEATTTTTGLAASSDASGERGAISGAGVRRLQPARSVALGSRVRPSAAASSSPTGGPQTRSTRSGARAQAQTIGAAPSGGLAVGSSAGGVASDFGGSLQFAFVALLLSLTPRASGRVRVAAARRRTAPPRLIPTRPG